MQRRRESRREACSRVEEEKTDWLGGTWSRKEQSMLQRDGKSRMKSSSGHLYITAMGE